MSKTPKLGRPLKGKRPMTSTERATAARARALAEAAAPKGTVASLLAEWNVADEVTRIEFRRLVCGVGAVFTSEPTQPRLPSLLRPVTSPKRMVEKIKRIEASVSARRLAPVGSLLKGKP